MEEWKDIPGFEGVYKISNFGQVKSTKFNKEKILKLDLTTKGYYQIKLYNGTSRKWYLVHRLVCASFLDVELLNSNLVVNHKNGIRNDNRLDNLEIISLTNNTIDGIIRKNEYENEDYNSDNIKYISKNNWEVYYKNMFIGVVKNVKQARVAINTAKIIFKKLENEKSPTS